MSDEDDQDKTRIQPRLKRPAPVRSAPQKREDPSGVQTETGANIDDGFAKTQALGASITKSRKAGDSGPAELLKGRFVLERVLGAGGMGVVYKAKDLLKVEAQDRDPYVAIKVLGEEFKSHPEAFIALQRESRKTQRIAHPNIVNVHDFDKDGDTVFMTMEYLEGTPLDKVIKKVRGVGLPRDEAWQILEGVCAALSYAHEQRLIHSDLKPGNIFVTNNGLAKVFDFGIARAVAKAEQSDATEFEDKTVFDAGNLGALTPAYASLEMLEGDPPDIRDDIYALGCIAYELFSGNHPFKRKNAKEVFRRGFKLERIKSISKKQWRAIEGALALEREDRIGSVQEFWLQLTTKSTNTLKLWTAIILVGASVALGVSSQFTNNTILPQEPQPSEDDYRSKFRLEMAQQNLTELFGSLTFDTLWESALWEEVQALSSLLGRDDPQTVSAYEKAYSEYLNKISNAIGEQNFKVAKRWISSAKKYTADASELNALSEEINNALAEQQRLLKAKLEQERKEKVAAAAAAAARKSAQVKVSSDKQFKSALKVINEQLECNRLLDMSYFESTLKKLKQVDSSRYKKAEPEIINNLADCIARITRNFPTEGLKAQNAAKAIFTSSSIFNSAKVKASKNDFCKETLAGLGARGRRSRCQDALASGTKSPITVVVPASADLKIFAIGRYEVRVGEYNQFCIATNSCSALTEKNTALPATGLPYKNVQAYLTWLSEQSGRVYRLPTFAEWSYAAKAKRVDLDSNRNCKLNIRGIQKGGTLIQASIGQQNSWGLVNHVGNASEWVTQGEQLVAVGGSYNTEMANCTLDEKHNSNGNADDEIGFRVLRQL